MGGMSVSPHVDVFKTQPNRVVFEGGAFGE